MTDTTRMSQQGSCRSGCSWHRAHAAPLSSPLHCLPPPQPPEMDSVHLVPALRGFTYLTAKVSAVLEKLDLDSSNHSHLSREARPEGKHGLHGAMLATTWTALVRYGTF